jgi:hypothetical protein
MCIYAHMCRYVHVCVGVCRIGGSGFEDIGFLQPSSVELVLFGSGVGGGGGCMV